jgi:uncharacterized membrane protein YebE (DUF533 family)
VKTQDLLILAGIGVLAYWMFKPAATQQTQQQTNYAPPDYFNPG